MTSELLTPLEAAAFLKVAPGTLEAWRATKRVKLGYTKVGHLVRYERHTLQEFLESRRVNADRPASRNGEGKTRRQVRRAGQRRAAA